MGCGCNKNSQNNSSAKLDATAKQMDAIRRKQKDGVNSDKYISSEQRMMAWALENGNIEDFIRMDNERKLRGSQ